jgi:FMN phosphatase YigB (HAD superfamily)
LISATVSSSFSAAQLVDVQPAEAVMVGDGLRHDVEGAMRAVLLRRGSGEHPREREPTTRGVRVIRSLGERPNLIMSYRI